MPAFWGSIPLHPAAAAAESSTTDNAAASQLAADTGVDISEANARIARQPIIESFSAALETQLPEVLSGVWMDQADHGRVVVATTSPRSEVRDTAKRYGLEDLLVTRTAEYSLADLNRAFADAEATIGKVQDAANPLGVSMDIVRNQLFVQVQQGHQLTPAQTTWRDDLAKRNPGRVSTKNGGGKAAPGACSWPSCDPPLRGGLAIKGWAQGDTVTEACTSGFYVRSNTDQKPYLLTAGHCTVMSPAATWYEQMTSDSNWHVIGAVWNKYFDENGDMAIITINNPDGWTPQGTVYVRPSNDPGYPTVETPSYSLYGYSGAPTVDSYLCRTGATSGTHCGQFKSGNNIVYYGGVNVHYLGLIAMTSCEGDSGGPIYISHKAYGIFVAFHVDYQIQQPDGKGPHCTYATTYYQGFKGAMDRLNVSGVQGP